MKVLMVVNVFAPDRAGGASVFTDLAAGLAERGHDVEVWCAHPYYPEWKDKSSRNRWRVAEDREGELRLWRHWLWIPRNPASTLQRMLYEASFGVSILRRGGWRRFDVVLAFVPLIGGAAAAAIRSRVAGVPIVLSVQDLPAEAAEAGGFGMGSLARVFWRIQDAVFSMADRIVTISPVMARRIEDRHGMKAVDVVPNWLNASAQGTIDSLARRGRGEPSSGSPRLLYAGNIGEKQGLVRLVEVLMGTDLDFSFRLFGDGSAKARLRSVVEAAGDERFAIGPFLSEEAFLAAVAEADWFVIPERANHGASFIPSKLIPAIAMGTPIMAVTDSESPLGREVAEHSLGVVVQWDSLAAAIPDALLRRDHYVTQCLRRAGRYHRSRGIDDIVTALELAVRGCPKASGIR